MNKFPFYIAIVLVILLLTNCTKEVLFKGDETAASLVVDAVVENDSIFALRLERSVFFLDQVDNRKITSNAVLTLFDLTNDEQYEVTSPTEDNRYVFPTHVKPATNYKLQIAHPDFETVESTIQTVKTVPILSCDTATFIHEPWWQRGLITSLSWQDPPDEENFYMVVIRQTQEVLEEWEMEVQNLSFTTEDLDLIQPEVFEIFEDQYVTYQVALFNDLTFNGGVKTFDFEITHPFYLSNPDNFRERKIEIRLISVSKDFFKYWLDVKTFGNLDEFSEPLQIHTNIQNGFGIFGSLGYSVFTMQNY
ncbi:MAG: DUF4249 domain-containing protein [Crocinitomicaceae bacterium]|nr:DUF4249 domain-containing protein [Crocinitomicaceae bacterium]